MKKQEQTAAIYLRLSREDDGKGAGAESGSISAQRTLLTDYTEHLMQGQPYHIVEFCDDGYSGTDFDRPGFQAMIEAAKNGQLDLILVKDLSRFGRDYLEVGKYLEYIFPLLQIRFISVNDGYDSAGAYAMKDGTSLALKNLVHSMYSRDLSRKVHAAGLIRAKNGEFLASYAPYGYRKDPNDKHKLLIDETAASVVRRIFTSAAGGISPSEIARQLNEEQIPTRMMYHRANNANYPDPYSHIKKKSWSQSAVTDILTNETYLGTMFWNQRSCGIHTGRQGSSRPKEQWVAVENHHEAIVSRPLFEQAGRNLKKRSVNRRKQAEKKTSFLVCGYCGRSLQVRSTPRQYCRNRWRERQTDCRKVSIDRKKLEDTVLCHVNHMANLLLTKQERQDAGSKENRQKQLERTVSATLETMARCRDRKTDLYEQYRDGRITKERYLEQVKNVKSQLETLDQTLNTAREELARIQSAPEPAEQSVDQLRELSVLESFDREKVKWLIDKVIVYGEDQIEIEWKIKDPFVGNDGEK